MAQIGREEKRRGGRVDMTWELVRTCAVDKPIRVPLLTDARHYILLLAEEAIPGGGPGAVSLAMGGRQLPGSAHIRMWQAR